MGFPWLQAAMTIYGAFRYFRRPEKTGNQYKGGNIEVTATTNTPVPVVYGNCEVTGNIIYKEDSTSATNYIAVGLCEGPIESIDSVRVNGVNIPVAPDEYEGSSYTPYYGTPSQATDSRFTSSTMLATCIENNFADEAEPDTVQNWSATKRLYIEDDNGDNKSKYLFMKFSIAALNLSASGDIISAKLRLYKNSTSLTGDHTVYVYDMVDDSWSESTVKWSNKPSFGDQITTIAGSLFNGTQAYYDIDITGFVKDTYDYDANKIAGIGMKVVNNAAGIAQAIFTSRDSVGAPTVIIKYAPKELTAFAHTAYIALTLVDSELFKGHLNDIKVSVQGRLIYDGDLSPNYSRTPAWIVYDLLTNSRYGADIPSSLINASSFTAVASYNDTSVTTDEGTSEPRHRCDVVFNEKDKVADRINSVLASFGGFLYTVDGKINLGVDASASSSHSFTMNNIIDGSFSFWMIDKSEAPNDISVMYYDAANDFKASYVNVKDQGLIDSYGRNFEEIQLVCINRYSQAARMAKYYLNKTRYSTYGCSFKVSINHCNVAPGDVCEITHTVPGWNAKDFRIISVVEDGHDELQITCEEYDSDLYSDEGLPYTPPEGSELPNPNAQPPVVTGLTLTEAFFKADDGTYIPQIKVEWTEVDYLFPCNYIVWYKLHSASEYTFWEQSTDNLAYINVDAAGQYDVVVQTINIMSGIKSDFGTSPSDTITIAGKTAPPSDVQFNDINCTYYSKINLEWLPVTDTDLAGYELRTDTNWGNATNRVFIGKATAYVVMNPAAKSMTFYIKALDLSGNYSTNADSITMTKSDPVLGTVTVDFTGKDCILDWEHEEDEDFKYYQIQVYSDASRTTLIRTEKIASPPYVYKYEFNVADNSGTPIRHPYFTVKKYGTHDQTDTENCDGTNAAPSAPTGLTLVAGQGKLFITWTALTDPDIIGYNVYAKTSSPANTLVGFVNATAFTFDPEAENTYYVTVAGVDAFGEGTKCAEVSQTTNPYALTNYSLDVPISSGIEYTVAAGKLKWTTGKLWYEDAEYTIAAETTGKSAGFIYWDKDSPTVFQWSATAPALDDDIWVMAYFDGTDVYAAFAQKIIHGGLIQASSIEAEKLSVDDLSAISANLGTVTSGTLQTAASGQRAVVDGATNTFKFYNSSGVNVLKIDDNIGGVSGAGGIEISSTVGGRIYLYDTDAAGNTNVITQNSIATSSSAGGSPVNVTQSGSDLNDGVVRINYTPHDKGIFLQCNNDGADNFLVYADGDTRQAGDIIFELGTYDTTVTCTAPSAARTLTIPDPGNNASFVMTEGAQTVNGIKTFGSFPVTPSSAPTTDYQVANKKYVDDHSGSGTPAGSDTEIQYNNGGSFGGAAGLVYDDAHERTTATSLKAGSENYFDTSATDTYQDGLLLTSSQSAGQNNLGASIGFASHGNDDRKAAIVAKQTGADPDQIGLAFYTHSSAVASDAMESAVVIYHTGNISTVGDITAGDDLISTDDVIVGGDMILDRTNDVTITCAAAAAARTVTIPDPGSNASFVMNEGAQTVNGVKTFGSFPVTPSSAPTTNYQTANKKYVDDNIGAATPAGSDTQIQYNNGGAVGGCAGLVYDDVHGVTTADSINAGNNNYFDTATTNSYQDGVFLVSSQDVGINNYGASLAFSRHGTENRHCAIAVKQHTSDGDQVGLTLFTHPSATTADAMVACAEFDHNGNLHLLNGGTVFRNVSWSLLSGKLRGTADPTLSQVKTNGSGSTGVYAYSFDWGQTKEIFGSITIPLDYKVASTIYPHINRMLTNDPVDVDDSIRCGLEYTWCEEDGTMSNTTVAELEIAAGANAGTKLIRSELTAITGTAHAAGSTLLFRFYREQSTIAESEFAMWVTSIDFEYESDRLGSDTTTV
nr:MAG TPA: tail protein [Caudoviricetes sp.]